jgi:hypothetical protein
MQLATELHGAGFALSDIVPNVHCKVIKDKSGVLGIEQTPKMNPCTWHMNLAISMAEQVANILTKTLPVLPFQKLRKCMMGW